MHPHMNKYFVSLYFIHPRSLLHKTHIMPKRKSAAEEAPPAQDHEMRENDDEGSSDDVGATLIFFEQQ